DGERRGGRTGDQDTRVATGGAGQTVAGKHPQSSAVLVSERVALARASHIWQTPIRHLWPIARGGQSASTMQKGLQTSLPKGPSHKHPFDPGGQPFTQSARLAHGFTGQAASASSASDESASPGPPSVPSPGAGFPQAAT